MGREAEKGLVNWVRCDFGKVSEIVRDRVWSQQDRGIGCGRMWVWGVARQAWRGAR